MNRKDDLTDASQNSQVLTNTLWKKIADIPGVRRAEIVRGINEKNGLSWIETKDTFLEQYSKKLLKLIPNDVIEEEKRMHLQDHKFATVLIGIGEWEFNRISKKYNLNTDYGRFRLGKVGLWCYGPAYEDAEIVSEKANTTMLKVYPSSHNGKCFVLENMIEQPISVREFKNKGSYLDPNIIVSNEILETLKNNEIMEIDILTENMTCDERIYQILEKMFENYPEVTIYSKLKKVEDLTDSLNTLKTITTVLSFILFSVSIHDFTTFINNSLAVELAVLRHS